ncbi:MULTISPECIES: hypothetical protein [Mucilaginibacter]|jgi:hypothetical protein|uniref:hypothetical protein n=1 Tax=Mucilaginibacter TaxID=423349 RepID=UPI0008714D43|nr:MULTISPECIES: hypothetical protein [Mucilaginibacter]SCW82566.1 hypothetical protein SAMN03159284_04619 [Mucilaginibacter sp. NFR10]
MKKITPQFIVEFIATNNIPFIPTQSRLSIPIISRMCSKMEHHVKFGEIKICGKLIIDGHHRYLSSLIMNFELGQVATNLTSATKETPWNQIEFDENDWDSAAGIEHLNRLDAEYNKLELEFLRRITSNDE